MPLFSLAPPAPFTLEMPDVTVVSTGTLTAGAAFFSSYVLYAPVTVTKMRCYITALSGAGGNIDMGIYDATATNGAPNNMLGHTGAVQASTANSGVFTQSLTANLALAPGQYWIAWMDTLADTIGFRSSPVAGIGAICRTSATNLTTLSSANPAGTVANDIHRLIVEALLSGSWS